MQQHCFWLFYLMAVMAGYRKLGVFSKLAQSLLARVSGSRKIAAILILLCFFGSMLITNDVALITFVPFTLTVLGLADARQYMVPVVVLQTVAANLGGLGTLIASMASLISFKYIAKELPEKRKPYIICFSLVNLTFLVILYGLSQML